MSEFTLQRKEAETLRLNIGDCSVNIPLAGSLTPAKAKELETAAGTHAFFSEYLPEEITKTLTVDEWNAITRAWVNASGGRGKVGE